MGTGEGKSCVIAMFAVLRALRGEKVDVVSSSSVLCQRDAEEWVNFYKYFGITVDTNTNKTEDGDRKACYQKDVVYGTVETFAADHLRQTFEMKDVRPYRSYQCIIIDEVDSLLLDQGVQLTYLSSPMVSMQHLNIILAMIWSSVSQYGFLSTGHQTDGRAALVICETINKAKLIYEELKSSVPDGDIILYARSDNDSLSKIDKELCPGNIIIATNLAGRGTDIKVSKQVNNNGGLFVILSFLSENTRVELQAFGRTARKGKPGSAQVIVSTDHLQESLRTVPSLEAAKDRRDGLAVEKVEHMTKDIAEMKLREDLFAEYCKTLQDIYKNTDVDEQRAVVAIMNEFWGIWLQTKSEEIDQLKINELQESLKADLSSAKIQSQSNNSPSSSIYHYIKFGNIAMGKKQWDISARLFEKAMNQDESWAAIAFYSHACCTVKKQEKDYLSKARDDLTKALESLTYLSEECIVCLQLVKISTIDSASSDPTSLETQLNTKLSMLNCFKKNISEAINKLMEIKERKRDAEAKTYSVFSLVPDSDEDLQMEAYNLYDQAQVGLGLITEGLSDCLTGIEAMVTGEFSWTSWAIDKAISIGVSLIGFGVGKLIAKGFKSSKMLIKDKQQFYDLMQDEIRKSELQDIFNELGHTALQPFYADLSWQNRLNSSIFSVMDRAEAEAKGKAQGILTIIKVVHMTALAAEATYAVCTLSTKFFSNFHKELNKFEKEQGLHEKVKAGELSASDTEMLKEFKQDIISTISTSLADAVVEVFHQKFSSHIVSHVQGKANGFIGQHVSTGLKSQRTEEKIRAGQNNRYISYMPGDFNSKHKLSEDARSLSHAEKIRNSETVGTILDIRVLSETTGTKVVILEQDSHGKLTKMQELNPSTRAASQTVSLIYRPKSAQYPDGHYDVLINNQTVNVVSEGRSCLFHALARGMRPGASEEEITSAADRLRNVEADALLRHPTMSVHLMRKRFHPTSLPLISQDLLKSARIFTV
ncbi:hypothetical protein AAFF_G00341980 [Aldrovandia affinis]|uniref:Uncharacterized protein n=1 Tax=Aldrovandia affinis TaxID=143900 RepID=A0AAD7VZ53_9TELE|nr:hypothetical protein AAFF_G00341980 [Aldrovandia affinis]